MHVIKKMFIVILFCFLTCFFVSCKKNNTNEFCLDYQITIADIRTTVANQFKEIGRLKGRLEGAEEYIKTLEQENDSLRLYKMLE